MPSVMVGWGGRCADPRKRERLTGKLIEPNSLGALYDHASIKAADHLVKRANIHLRYYCEEWMDGLLGFVKHYYVPDMEYWRYEALSGYGRYLGLDPSDEAECERRWN